MHEMIWRMDDKYKAVMYYWVLTLLAIRIRSDGSKTCNKGGSSVLIIIFNCILSLTLIWTDEFMKENYIILLSSYLTCEYRVDYCPNDCKLASEIYKITKWKCLGFSLLGI